MSKGDRITDLYANAERQREAILSLAAAYANREVGAIDDWIDRMVGIIPHIEIVIPCVVLEVEVRDDGTRAYLCTVDIGAPETLKGVQYDERDPVINGRYALRCPNSDDERFWIKTDDDPERYLYWHAWSTVAGSRTAYAVRQEWPPPKEPADWKPEVVAKDERGGRLIGVDGEGFCYFARENSLNEILRVKAEPGAETSDSAPSQIIRFPPRDIHDAVKALAVDPTPNCKGVLVLIGRTLEFTELGNKTVPYGVGYDYHIDLHLPPDSSGDPCDAGPNNLGGVDGPPCVTPGHGANPGDPQHWDFWYCTEPVTGGGEQVNPNRRLVSYDFYEWREGTSWELVVSVPAQGEQIREQVHTDSTGLSALVLQGFLSGHSPSISAAMELKFGEACEGLPGSDPERSSMLSGQLINTSVILEGNVEREFFNDLFDNFQNLPRKAFLWTILKEERGGAGLEGESQCAIATRHFNSPQDWRGPIIFKDLDYLESLGMSVSTYGPRDFGHWAPDYRNIPANHLVVFRKGIGGWTIPDLGTYSTGILAFGPAASIEEGTWGVTPNRSDFNAVASWDMTRAGYERISLGRQWEKIPNSEPFLWIKKQGGGWEQFFIPSPSPLGVEIWAQDREALSLVVHQSYRDAFADPPIVIPNAMWYKDKDTDPQNPSEWKEFGTDQRPIDPPNMEADMHSPGFIVDGAPQ